MVDQQEVIEVDNDRYESLEKEHFGDAEKQTGIYAKHQESGLKYDQEKPRMDLLDPGFLEETAHVLTFGACKYAAHNWRGGIAYSRLIAAIYRHLGAINRGEDIDPESGRLHTGHLGCCVQFLDWMLKNRPDLDDRYKK